LLFVGLGNPGAAYAHTRHNIGFMVIDALLARSNYSPIVKKEFQGELYKNGDTFLLKPHTYMNRSGDSVIAVKNFYKIDIENIVVIHDDLDLPFGTLRFKRGGGHGGHNGLKSCDVRIGKEYIRIRMGIGKPEYKGEVVSYVLGAFNEQERTHLPQWIAHTCNAIEQIERLGLEKVASQYSIKKNPLQ